MAEETVVKEMLTQEMIQAGAEITRRLDEAHLEVRASLWWYIPDKNLWRLIVASPAVRLDGPKKVYQKIQTILSTTYGSPIFKAVQQKRCTALYRVLKNTPKPLESAAGAGSEPSYVDRSVAVP